MHSGNKSALVLAASLGMAMLFPTHQLAASVVGAKHFDADENDLLDRSEFEDMCAHLAFAETRSRSGLEYDDAKDVCFRTYVISSGGNASYAGYSVTEAQKKLFAATPASEEPKPFERLGSFRVEGDSVSYGSTGFLLRSEYEDISIRQIDTAQGENLGLKTSEPASLSFTRDFENDGNIAQIKGALGYPIFLELNDPSEVRKEPRLTDLVLLPSVSIDRINDQTDSSKEADSLAFRFGGEVRIADFGFSSQYVQFGGLYNTDTEFEAEIYAAELNWRPVIRGIGIGQMVPRNAESCCFLRWLPQLHAEWGYTADASANPSLTEDEEFARIGPRVNVDIWIGDRTKLYANYYYYFGLTGDTEDNDLLTTGVSFDLDPKSNNWTIGAEYRNGQLPVKLDDVETLTLNLGVRF